MERKKKVDAFRNVYFKNLENEAIKKKSFAVNTDFSRSLYIIEGEGNGNPLQYSCMENPMDGGAW